MIWGAAAAKAKFSALLDEAESHGPQLVQRRKQQYLVVTREQWDQRATTPEPASISAWDSLALPENERVDWELPKMEGEVRVIEF